MMGEIIQKPWGKEEILVKNDKYVIKRIMVAISHRMSLQYHRIKRETWIVVKGSGLLTLGGETSPYQEGDIVDIPSNTIHRVYANGAKGVNTVIFEISTPELDDVVRLADDYGRV